MSHAQLAIQLVETILLSPMNTVKRRLIPPNYYLFAKASHSSGVMAISSRDKSAYIFRSYDHLPHDTTLIVYNLGYASNVLIANVARATTAAPTYFQHANLRGERFIDGGIGYNNPSWTAFSEVTEMHQQHRQNWRSAHQIVEQSPTTDLEKRSAVGVLVSIGTGKPRPARLIGRAGLSRYVDYIRLTREMATDSERTHRSMVERIADIRDTHYYRFNVPTGLEDIKLDEWKTSKDPQGRIIPDTLRKIEVETNIYLQNPETRRKITECAKKLVELRRARKTG